MKAIKTLTAIIAVLAMLAPVTMQAKGKEVPSIYMFGFSASFTDSIVYFTEVQEVNKAWIDTKTKFLMGRENYSLQLKGYLATAKEQPNRTCIVVFGLNRKDCEKKYLKMKRLYTVKSKGGYDVRYIAERDFKFQPIDMGYEEADTPTTAPETIENKPAKPEGAPEPPAGLPTPPQGGQAPGQMPPR